MPYFPSSEDKVMWDGTKYIFNGDSYRKSGFQWILQQPCGCVTGVLDGACANNWLQAAVEFYDTDAEIERFREDFAAGVKIERITHQEYVDKYRHHLSMEYNCPHQTVPGFWRRVFNLVIRKGRR